MAINIKDAPFGAAGNTKYLIDGVMTAGQPDLHSASATFVIGDVGKTIWCVDSATVALTGQTTIIAFVDANHVILAVNATHNSAGAQVTYGTDDTDAFLSAYDASRVDPASTIYSVGSFLDLFMPPGGYLVTRKFYANTGGDTGVGSFGLMGENVNNTIIFPSPDCPIPNDGTPVWMDISGGKGQMKGFSVIGPDFLYNMQVAGMAAIRFSNCTADVDISVTRLGSFFGTVSAVSVENSVVNGTFFIQEIGQAISHQTANAMTGLTLKQSAGDLTKIVVSNFKKNLIIDGCVSRQGIPQQGSPGPELNFWGGLIDENHSEATSDTDIINGSNPNFYGVTLWTGGTYAVSVEDTSTAYFQDCDLGCYNVGALSQKALSIAPGATVVAGESTFRAVSLTSPVSVDNEGKFVDVGGNNYLNGGTGVNLPVRWQDAFLNPNDIWRS